MAEEYSGEQGLHSLLHPCSHTYKKSNARVGAYLAVQALQKQQKLAYGMELQQQAKMQEEKKRQERNERLGISGTSPGPGNNVGQVPANFSPSQQQQQQNPIPGYGSPTVPPPNLYGPPSPQGTDTQLSIPER